MSADLCGPFPAGRDLGTGVTCKYALISTVAVPIVSELPGEVAEPYDTADDVKHTEDLPCDPEEREMLSDDEVQRLNELAQIEEAQEAPGHQNITFAEVIPDRTVESLVRALSRLHAKYRMLGIQVYRLHTDRERSFASVPIQKWCEQRQLRLTLTAGDDSKANGRIEGEVNQIKRRTRLLLHDSGLPQSLWRQQPYDMLQKAVCAYNLKDWACRAHQCFAMELQFWLSPNAGIALDNFPCPTAPCSSWDHAHTCLMVGLPATRRGSCCM